MPVRWCTLGGTQRTAISGQNGYITVVRLDLVLSDFVTTAYNQI